MEQNPLLNVHADASNWAIRHPSTSVLCVCEQRSKDVVSLCICTGSTEPCLLDNSLDTKSLVLAHNVFYTASEARAMTHIAASTRRGLCG